MVTINKIVEFLETTVELAPEDVSKLKLIFDQVDLSKKYGVADSNISIKEWIALRDTLEFQGFMDQTFGRSNEDAQTSFTTQLNTLFRPTTTKTQPSTKTATSPTENSDDVIVDPIPQEYEQISQLLSSDIPERFSDLDPTTINQYLDEQVDFLRNDDLPISDRVERGHFLVEQLKSEELFLEAASLYEELSFLFARFGDQQAEQILQAEAKYWRHLDTYQDPYLASIESLKEDLQNSLDGPQFYPSQKITEAQLAILNHDFDTAKKSLKDLGWWILQIAPGYESKNLDALSAITILGPWHDPASASIPEYLKPYWTQAKQIYEGVLIQEKRETALELLMLEAKQDQFNLSDEMQHQVDTAGLGNSSGVFDKYVAYRFQTFVSTFNTEDYFLKKYEDRMAFRYLLQTILISGEVSTLEDAVKIALESDNPQILANYESWQSWRNLFKEYGVGFTVTYDRSLRESKIYGRSDLDGYWREQISEAKNNNNYDKVLMYYDTILEADLVKAKGQIPFDQVLSIKAQAEQKASKRKQSIWEPIIAQLKRQYPDKRDDELNALAKKAFESVVEQYQQEQLHHAALFLLEKRRFFADGPFSRELRQEVLDDYQKVISQKKEIDFEQSLTTMVLIQVPLIIAGVWVASLAVAGTSTLLTRGAVAFAGSEEAAAGLMAKRAYIATHTVLGTAVAGTAFHTTESLLTSPIQGSAAFDHYIRGCALSTGMFAAVDAYKFTYGVVANPWFNQRYATGTAELINGRARLTLTPGAESARFIGEISGESLVMTGYGYLEEQVRGGPGTLEDHSFGDRYADAVMTVLALRGGQKLTEFSLAKLKSNLKHGDNLRDADVVRRLADANIYLLSPKDFRDLAIRMDFPEMSDVPALTDTKTGFVFINRAKISAENPLAQINCLIEHEEVHRRLEVTDFNSILSQSKWTDVKQKYLNTIYIPNGGTKQLSDIEILEEIVAHYRTWSRFDAALSPQETTLKTEFATLLAITGLANHPIFGDIQALPVIHKDRNTRLAAAWPNPTEVSEPSLREQIRTGQLTAVGVSVVVPVFRELDNGNFFRMLECFTQQTANTKNFEIVMVINNTPEVSRNRGHPAFVENQRTLELAYYVARQSSLPPSYFYELPNWQQEIIFRARKCGLQLQVIDKSTRGMIKQIGTIRDVGVQRVIRTHGDDRIISMFDADTIVPKDYIENLLIHFMTSGADAVFMNLRHEIFEGSYNEILYRTSYIYRYKQIWANFLVTLSGRNNSGVSVGGPQIAAKSSAFRAVGGVPHQDMAEDYTLSQQLSVGGRNYRFAHDLYVTTADRARKDGYDAAERILNLDFISAGGKKVEVYHYRNPAEILLGNTLDKYKLNPAELTDEKLSRLFEYYGYTFEKTRWEDAKKAYCDSWQEPWNVMPSFMLYHFYLTAESRGKLGVSSASQSPDVGMMTLLRRHLTQNDYGVLTARIDKAASEHNDMAAHINLVLNIAVDNVYAGRDLMTGINDPLAHEFLRLNPWIPKYIDEAKTSCPDAEAMKMYLDQQFPDWLNTFNKTQGKQTVVRLQIIMQFMQEARNKPELYPSMTAFLTVADRLEIP